jgi:integrase
MAGEYLTKRGAYWQYVRRVPTYVEALDQRGFIRISTKKTVRAEALIIADRINRETEAFWQSLFQDRSSPSLASYEEAIKRARILGVSYKPVMELAKGNADEIVERTENLQSTRLVSNKHAICAVLGGVQKPNLRLSKLLDQFFDLSRDNLHGKSEDQIRKWKNPRKKAVRNLIKVIGDKPLSEITRHDALDFRAWWIDRIENEHMDPGTANKDIGNINQIINDLDDKLRIDLGKPFAGMRLKGEKHNPRIAYKVEFVQSHLLADNALEGLNLEAQIVIYVMAGTGARPSELVNLSPSDINLKVSTPHIRIRPHDRVLKTEHSRRDIPLVGVALSAMQRLPSGFTRYKGKTDSLSALINKYLMDHELRPTPGHTLYSLRHTFQDRLISVEVPERIQAELMGHKFHRPKYGSGPSLEQKAAWLEKIAYLPPAILHHQSG